MKKIIASPKTISDVYEIQGGRFDHSALTNPFEFKPVQLLVGLAVILGASLFLLLLSQTGNHVTIVSDSAQSDVRGQLRGLQSTSSSLTPGITTYSHSDFRAGVSDVVIGRDGDLWVTGIQPYYYGSSLEQQPFLQHINPDGSVQQGGFITYAPGTVSQYRPATVQLSAQKDKVYVAYPISDAQGSHRLLTVFSPEGTALSSLKYPYEYGLVTPTSTGDFLFASSIGILKTDGLGNAIWSQQFSKATGYVPRSLFEVDGDVYGLFSHTAYFFNQGNRGTDILARLNGETGAVSWSFNSQTYPYKYQDPVGWTDISAQSTMAPCGPYLCIQTPTDVESNLQYSVLFPNGTLRNQFQMSSGHDSRLLPNGNVLIEKTVSDSNYDTVRYWMNVDLLERRVTSAFSEGDIPGRKYFGSNSYRFSSVDRFEGVGYSALGNWTDASLVSVLGLNFNDMVVTRFPTVPGELAGCAKKLDELDGYPGPAIWDVSFPYLLNNYSRWWSNASVEIDPFTSSLLFELNTFELSRAGLTDCKAPEPYDPDPQGNFPTAAVGGGLGAAGVVLFLLCIAYHCRESTSQKAERLRREVEMTGGPRHLASELGDIRDRARALGD